MPLGEQEPTSIPSIREYRASAEQHSPSAEENCLTENVASLRSIKVATPPCAAKAAIPLWTCRDQTVLTNRFPPASLKEYVKSRGCRKSLFDSLSKFVRIEMKGNPDGSLSNDPSLRTLKASGFIDSLSPPYDCNHTED